MYGTRHSSRNTKIWLVNQSKSWYKNPILVTSVGFKYLTRHAGRRYTETNTRSHCCGISKVHDQHKREQTLGAACPGTSVGTLRCILFFPPCAFSLSVSTPPILAMVEKPHRRCANELYLIRTLKNPSRRLNFLWV